MIAPEEDNRVVFQARLGDLAEMIGDPVIDGGDEFSSQVYSGDTTKLTLKDIAVFSPDTGSVWTPGAVLRTSEIYKADGTPFAFYDKMGRPITSAPNASGLGTLVTLTNSNFSARSFFGDVRRIAEDVAALRGALPTAKHGPTSP